MRGLARPLVAAFLLVLSAPVAAEDAGEATYAAAWRAVDAETGQIRGVEGLEQLARDFPDSGSVRLRMLQPLMDAGEIDKVLETLEWLYDRGYVFSETGQAQIGKLVGSIAPGRVAERLRAEAEVIAASEVIATVPAEAGLVESALVYPGAPTIMVSSVSGKAIWSSSFGSKWASTSFDDAGPMSGIAYDPRMRAVWAASGDLFGSGDARTASGKLYEVVSPMAKKRVLEAGGSKALSDLTVHENGSIYASDPVGGGVYYADYGFRELEPLIPPGTFRSPQGLASSADGTKLYVSDYRYGIAIVDLATRKVSRLGTDLPLILDGVDGMWRHNNELIVVQNGTSPMRIAAFELSEDGRRVIGHRILEQSNPEWTEPLSGSVDGDALIYIGNGQWDRYVDGELAEGKEALPTQIRRLPLD